MGGSDGAAAGECRRAEPTISNPSGASATTSLAGCEGLSRRQFAVERRMLDKVADDHMPAAARESCLLNIRGRELLWKLGEDRLERIEGVEHFAVPRGIGAAAFHHVGAVRSVSPGGVEELTACSECLAECGP